MTAMRNLSLLRIYRFGLFVALVVIALVLPNVTSPYIVRVAMTIVVYTCLAIGLNLILGYAGLVSFGHAAFFGVGAYAVALLMVNGEWSFLPATGVAIIAALVAGALVGLTAWRVRGE